MVLERTPTFCFVSTLTQLCAASISPQPFGRAPIHILSLAMNQSEEKTPGQKVSKVSCERCRYRRIRCDRMQPCPACRKGNHECVYPQSEKSRPVPKGYVQALEGQIASLELFITKLVAADASKRDEMLANFSASTNHLSLQWKQSSALPKSDPLDTPNIPIRPRTGHLRKLKDEYPDDTTTPTLLPQSGITSPILSQTSIVAGGYMQEHLAFSPRSDICKYLMRIFFRHQYQYHMCLYREYFLRDFDAGTGPYYSDLLMYAICSMGALASESTAQRELSDMFSNRAQELLYGFALESPNLTALQALILLGHREIGHGKTSKGEILRRTYWAAFVADKQLSLYFGRPPALYPGESDVHDTVRIPYPPEWKSLLNKYIMPGTSETTYEDGLTLVASWVHQIELCKILHGMITKVFENRNLNTDPTILATSIRVVDVALTKWLKDLPAKLQWSRWDVADVPLCPSSAVGPT
ncbi:50424cff-b6cd-4f33-83de-260214776e72, partial [Sclerotinia trifoliorum]